MMSPFGVESEETRAMARHCTVGIEPRISSERIILLDTQVEKLVVSLGLVCLLHQVYRLSGVTFSEIV